MAIRENIINLADPMLVRESAEGNEEALKVLYSRYNIIIFNHLYRMTHDRVAAEDLTEETFFRVWRKAPLFDENKGSFKTWLFRMASRLAINRMKKRIRREKRAPQVSLPQQDLADGSRTPLEEAHALEARDRIHNALSTLNDKDRAVLVLRHLEGKGEQEVATILGIPKGTVKSRTYYAVRRLKVALQSTGL